MVLHVLYLVFNEGYTASSGPTCSGPSSRRGDPAGPRPAPDAARRRRGRRAARADAADRCPAAGPDRRRRRARPARRAGPLALGPGVDRRGRRADQRLAAPRAALGAYQLQAAIAAVHDEAPTRRRHRLAADRRALRLLARLAPNPMVALNQAVAIAMVDGPRAGLERLDALADDERIAGGHRLDAVRGHLLEMAGDAPRRGRATSPPPGARRASRSGATSRRAQPEWRNAGSLDSAAWIAPSRIQSCVPRPGGCARDRGPDEGLDPRPLPVDLRREQTASAVEYVAHLDRTVVEDGTYYVFEVGDEIVACGGWSRRGKLYTGSGDAADDARLIDQRPSLPGSGRCSRGPTGRVGDWAGKSSRPARPPREPRASGR